MKVWSRAILIAGPDQESCEPQFILNRNKEFIQKGQKAILYASAGILTNASIYLFNLYKQINLILLLITNPAGEYIGYLLVLKQLNIHSSLSEKICSLFKENECNTQTRLIIWGKSSFNYLSNVSRNHWVNKSNFYKIVNFKTMKELTKKINELLRNRNMAFLQGLNGR